MNYIEELESIIRALADVWPADRDNVAVAGAKFEELLEGLDQNVGQLQKLIDLAWEGLKHLYGEDDYFLSVKAATMQAVNTIREYLIKDGDIQVKDFEKACGDLEKALSGDGESADTLIEMEEAAAAEQAAEPAGEEGSEPEKTLDDLASAIMMLSEDTITDEELEDLNTLLKSLVSSSPVAVATSLKEAMELVGRMAVTEAGKRPEGWLDTVSEITEKAIHTEDEVEWQESTGEAEAEAGEADTEAPAAKDDSPAGQPEDAEVFYIPADIEVAMIGEFVTECSDLLESAESALLDLEENPDDDELINTIFRAFHTIKGTSAFMGLEPISEFTHLVETLLSMVRDGELPFDAACADISLESIDIIKKMLDVVETAGGGDPLPRPQRYNPMTEVLDRISNEGAKPGDAYAKAADGFQASAEAVEEAPAEVEEQSGPVKPVEQEKAPADGNASKPSAKASESSSSKSETESSVRVNVSRLDRLIDMVGELVIAHSVVAQDKAIAEYAELQKKVNHTSKILRELQDTSLSLRMVPLKATFHKMNRLVRDLSRKAGKKVKFSTFGEDTEIDRNMVDIINEPLVHMLRNALDHGIEDPATREKNGKPASANIWLRASQEGGKVVIEIEDDGRGIDKDKILEKAISKGLIDPDKKLTDKEIYNLIFLPGFSSVDKVTDLSGRGVGMDVVRRNIDQLQGKVDVSSELGKGTKISLELPFTLAITDGMLVRVGSQRFIVPTINIDMTFRAEEDDLYTVMGDSEQVSFRGRSVPVIRLHRLFDIGDGIDNLMEGTLIVIKNNESRYALFVDEVLGQQQLVGKSINMMVKMHHISGGAILGDGRVGLILNTAALMN